MSDTSVSAEIVVLEASPEEVLIVTIAERGADGASDHGLLSGLADDDHLQYHNDARGDARYAAIAHTSDTANPHAVTAAQAGADATGTAATLIAAHEIAPDPHSIYSLETDLGTAAYLDAGTAVGDLVQVQTGGKLPALDGSALTSLPGGVSDHGALTGLVDDDHTQYHTDARGDARYAPIAKGVTGGDSHNHNGGDGAQIAYASLSDLPTLGSAAAAATGDFEPSGTVSTHNAVSTAHGISAWGATLVDDADANTARSTLGLGTAATTASTAYEASGAVGTHAALTTAHGISAFGATLVDDADAATARATLSVPSGSGTSTGTNTGDSATPAETATTIGALLNSATIKTTPVDADYIGLMDSAASNIWKKLSWANLKTMLLGGSPITDFFKNGSVVMNTNPFGGRKLFINSINNALFRAEARWVVTGNLFLTADDSLISAISPTELAKLFGGNYEGFLTVPVGSYAVININFSTEAGGTYPNYPYGTFFLSYYNTGYPSSTLTSTVSVYSTYAPHGIGWHSANFAAFHSGTGQRIDSAYLNKYAISQVELKIYAPDSGAATLLSQLDLNLDRPSSNEMPIVDKFKENKLYAKLSTETLTPRVAGTYDLGESGTPYRRLFLRHTTEQLRVEYDASNYLGSTTNSAGVTTFNLVGTAPAAKWAVSDATTNAIHDVATFSKNSTGAGAAGLGARIVLAAKSSTTVDTPQAGISSEWVNATHATRTSRLKLSANDYGGAREGIRVESDGAVPRLGFYGATAVVKPTALTATASAAPAGGTGTADGGWDTSINRDMAITTINNLKTRVDQLETKLQALGLLT